MTMGNDFNPYREPLRRPFWELAGEAMHEVNQAFRENLRVGTLMLPLFDGINQIKWKDGYLDKLKD